MSPKRCTNRAQADEALVRARRISFLDASTDDANLSTYRTWCQAENRPFVSVLRKRGTHFAELWMDLRTCNWSLAPHSEQRIQRVVDDIRRRGTPSSSAGTDCWPVIASR
jgi:hypothetical protein